MDLAGWKLKVEALRALGDHTLWREMLEKHLPHFAREPGVHKFAAEQYAALGEFMEALQHYDACVRSAHTDLEALLCGALMLSELGYYEEAHLRFQAVRQFDEDGGEKLYHKSLCPPGVAVSTLRGRSEQLLVLAESEWERGDLDRAGALVEQAIAIIDSPEGRLLAARLHLHLGAPARALENLEVGRRMKPDWGVFQVLAARCYTALGRPKQARDAIQRAELLGERGAAARALAHEAGSW
jgi:tetratricopeptide (TPR) repeat protein